MARGGPRATRAIVGAAAVALASCSLVTPFGGLSGASEDAGSAAVQDAESLPPDASDAGVDAGPSKPKAWRKIEVSGPSPRHSGRMAFDTTRSRAVLFGGVTSDSVDETWEWDGAAWSKPALTGRPSARRSAGMVYDSARGVVVVFAGLEASPTEPWEWDGGSTWRSSGVSVPRASVRNGAAMAYDVDRDVIVVFGGHDPVIDDRSNATWEWSAKAGFVKRSPGVSPPKRRGHLMAYDTKRKRVLVFGGDGDDGNERGDLWEWDGTTWTPRTSSFSPSPRAAPCGAWDSTRSVLVVFGGRQGDTSFDDTWEWNGEAWSKGPTGPSPRRSCGITYDAARKAVVMFGGSQRTNNTNGALGDTWLYE